MQWQQPLLSFQSRHPSASKLHCWRIPLQKRNVFANNKQMQLRGRVPGWRHFRRGWVWYVFLFVFVSLCKLSFVTVAIFMKAKHCRAFENEYYSLVIYICFCSIPKLQTLWYMFGDVSWSLQITITIEVCTNIQSFEKEKKNVFLNFTKKINK